MKNAANAAPVDEAQKNAAARRIDAAGAMVCLPQAPGAARIGRALPLLAFALFSCVVQCRGETIRSKSDLRLWQAVHDRAAPLEWPWEDGADSATLTFSNRVTRTAWSCPVWRAHGEMRGCCTQPAVVDVETVIDVALEQLSGADVVARESATLAYVAGAGGGPITVRGAMGKPERELVKVPKPRVYAFDPAWLGEAGDSGYAVAWRRFRAMTVILR